MKQNIKQNMKKRLVIGMSGASGAPLTIELLKQLRQYREIIETHLIVTKGAQMTLEQETDYTLEQLYALADVVHDNHNIGAGPASGSYRTMGMIVIPCSMKTLAGIVSGYSDNLKRTPEAGAGDKGSAAWNHSPQKHVRSQPARGSDHSSGSQLLQLSENNRGL